MEVWTGGVWRETAGPGSLESVLEADGLGGDLDGHGEPSQRFAVGFDPDGATIVERVDSEAATAVHAHPVERRVGAQVEAVGVAEQRRQGHVVEDRHVEHAVVWRGGGGDGQARSEGAAVGGGHETSTRRGQGLAVQREAHGDETVGD